MLKEQTRTQLLAKYDDKPLADLMTNLAGQDMAVMAEAMHAVGIRCEKPGDLDHSIREMIEIDRPVLFDCLVDPAENCFPMIPSGRAHNEMILGDAAESLDSAVTEEGKMLV